MDPLTALQPMRDALCWDFLGGGCATTCTRLHPLHVGTPICGRHATEVLGMWGRRRRPPCPGGCGKSHPTAKELEAAIGDAIPAGSRLHAHVLSPPHFGVGEAPGITRSLFVAPENLPLADADAVLAARAPMPLRVAIGTRLLHRARCRKRRTSRLRMRMPRARFSSGRCGVRWSHVGWRTQVTRDAVRPLPRNRLASGPPASRAHACQRPHQSPCAASRGLQADHRLGRLLCLSGGAGHLLRHSGCQRHKCQGVPWSVCCS